MREENEKKSSERGRSFHGQAEEKSKASDTNESADKFGEHIPICMEIVSVMSGDAATAPTTCRSPFRIERYDHTATA